MTEDRTVTLITVIEGRLDKVLTLAAQDQAPDMGLSRSRIQQLIKAGAVTAGGSAGRIMQCNAKIQVVPDAEYEIIVPPPEHAAPEPQDIPLSILFEDNDMLVLDKPVGLVVHPGAGNWDRTLVNALLYHCGDSLSGIGGVARPGIVHRLDKETSGLMVVAKNDHAHQTLTSQFSDRTLSRLYKALIWGVPTPLEGEVEGNIGRHHKSRQKMAVVTGGGKEALTRYKVLEVLAAGNAALVSCKLATGRTHQIRVHMAHIGHPVIGDPLYCGRRGYVKNKRQHGFIADMQEFPHQALHAGEIGFIHPRTGEEMHFETPMPEDMEKLTNVLKLEK